MVWTALTLAPALMASDAAVWRRSWGVTVGNFGFLFTSRSTAGLKTRGRQVDTRTTAPPGDVNTRSSRCFPAMSAAKDSARKAGNGTDRRSCDLGVDQTSRPPTSATA